MTATNTSCRKCSCAPTRCTRVWLFFVRTCPKRSGQLNAQVVIGSIQGDVHDIGKNLVKMMFDVAGWEVHDLGRDVPLEKFVEEQLRTDSEVVAMSAMMTTTMLGMKKVIKMIKEKNPNVAIMLGGAPVTQDVAKLFGADGYAESAGNAVSEGIKMIGRLQGNAEKVARRPSQGLGSRPHGALRRRPGIPLPGEPEAFCCFGTDDISALEGNPIAAID